MTRETQDVNEMGVDQTASELERIAETLKASAYDWDREHAAVILRAVEIFRLARWENAEDAANWWSYDLSRKLHRVEREAFKEGYQRGLIQGFRAHYPAPSPRYLRACNLCGRVRNWTVPACECGGVEFSIPRSEEADG